MLARFEQVRAGVCVQTCVCACARVRMHVRLRFVCVLAPRKVCLRLCLPHNKL